MIKDQNLTCKVDKLNRENVKKGFIIGASFIFSMRILFYKLPAEWDGENAEKRKGRNIVKLKS